MGAATPGCWLSAWCGGSLLVLSCHLHSTDTPEFWEEEDEDDTGGSASVSMTAAVSELEDGEDEEEDEEDAATVPVGQTDRFGDGDIIIGTNQVQQLNRSWT